MKDLAKQPPFSTLLLTNQAIVRGALEAGVTFAATYPGTPASEIGDTFYRVFRSGEIPEFRFEYAVNEKAAIETVIGFSQAGHRAMASMKHVGLNVAADAFMTFAYLGVKGGTVIVSADDPGCHSSQNEQDNRLFAKLAYMPMIEPATPQEAKDLVVAAYPLSEDLAVPILLRLTTRIAHMRGIVDFGPFKSRPENRGVFVKDPYNLVVLPANARRLHPKLLKKLARAEAIFGKAPFARFTPGEGKVGIIATGVSRNYVKNILQEYNIGAQAALLEMAGTNPLPKTVIADFLAKYPKVLIVEELQPFVEDQVLAIAGGKGLGVEVLGKHTDDLPEVGEFDIDTVARAMSRLIPDIKVGSESVQAPDVPIRPPVLCPGCPHRATYAMVKEVIPDAIWSTDIGCYTLGINKPFEMADLLVCMGASVTAGGALSVAQQKPVVAFIGDSTFFHMGLSGLANAIFNRHNLLLVVLDNTTTAMTGFQPNPGWGGQATIDIEKIAQAMGAAFTATVDPYDTPRMLNAIKQAASTPGVSVIVSKSPCVQAGEKSGFTARITTKYRIERSKCQHCGNLDAGRHCRMPIQRDYTSVRVNKRLWSMDVKVDMPKALENPPCTAACPINLCAQGYVGYVAAGDFEGAFELVRKRLPLPSLCAYVCHHPCEDACTLNAMGDDPVAIRMLKRAAIHFGRRGGVLKPGEPTGKRVAVVGGGPAGLSAASDLIEAGHGVTIFEASDRLGGIPEQVIPEFRLPREEYEKDIRDIVDMGVDVKLNRAMGRDFSLQDLQKQYDAVLLCIGRTEPRRLAGAEGVEGVVDAMAFLRDPDALDLKGRSVGVIGGGNTAMDTARQARRMGAEVMVFYRRDQASMPALPEEVHAAMQEGVTFEFLASPRSFENRNGQVEVVFDRMELKGTDADGRGRPVPVQGGDFVRSMDMCMKAIGERSGAAAVLQGSGVTLDKGGSIQIDPDTMMTSVDGVFAGGDGAMGQGTVIHAVRDGKAAAAAIDAFLKTGKAVVPDQYKPVKQEKTFKPPRFKAQGRLIEQDPIEWEGRIFPEGWTRETFKQKAVEEAGRCIQCGTCANCTACIDKTGCPAIIMGPQGPEILEDQCVGCGLCALVCPNDAIIKYKVE